MNTTSYHPCQVLVIGSGAAGLSMALRLARLQPSWHIAVCAKGSLEQTNTSLAQGGIAAVVDHLRDSFEDHVQDTLAAGGAHCDEATVRRVVAQGPGCIEELLEWGAELDRGEDGKLRLAREGGHRYSRVLHRSDHTGLEVQNTLLAQARACPNISLHEHHRVVQLLLRNNTDSTRRCAGALSMHGDSLHYWQAGVTYLATGGSGQVFAYTTNPVLATGDGVALAWRAGACIRGMQHLQFHPTALALPSGERRAFLISEAVRGFGAYLRNEAGERFMFRHHPEGEMATRQIVSHAITRECLKQKEKNVYMDLQHVSVQDLEARFPVIVDHLRKHGLRPGEDLIPVAPAAHYQCGGVAVDENGQSSLEGLYAGGECSHTGMHGADRLASNSLLEALVYARATALHLGALPLPETPASTPAPFPFGNVILKSKKVAEIQAALQKLMQESFGPMRLRSKVEKAFASVEVWKRQCADAQKFKRPEVIELQNLLDVAQLMLLDFLESQALPFHRGPQRTNFPYYQKHKNLRSAVVFRKLGYSE